jgi:hypothetical protein
MVCNQIAHVKRTFSGVSKEKAKTQCFSLLQNFTALLIFSRTLSLNFRFVANGVHVITQT